MHGADIPSHSSSVFTRFGHYCPSLGRTAYITKEIRYTCCRLRTGFYSCFLAEIPSLHFSGNLFFLITRYISTIWRGRKVLYIIFLLVVEVEVNLRPTVSRPVCLGVRHTSGTRDQFFFLLEISFRQLRVCYFVAPSLTRGWVCNLMLLASPAQSHWSLTPAGLKTNFIVPIVETPPTWRARSPCLCSSGTGWPRYTSGHWVHFSSPLTTRRAAVELF
jgi:hypothetical protein